MSIISDAYNHVVVCYGNSGSRLMAAPINSKLNFEFYCFFINMQTIIYDNNEGNITVCLYGPQTL